MKRVKTFKRTLSLLLCLIMVFGSAPLAGLVGIDLPNITNLFTPKAEAATKYTLNGSYNYEVFDGEAAIMRALVCGNVTIPSTLGGYPVTTIWSYAFENCKGLESVTLPDGVTSIGNSAFSGCRSLSSITIPDSVTSIGDEVFYNCTSLTSITIPGSVTSIGYKAFYDCTSLEDAHYTGTQAEWNAINMWGGNECLIEAQKVIRRPSRTSIRYGDSIVLHVKDSRIPEGGYVIWTADNDNFSYSVSSDGTICTISPKSSGSTVFTATVYDKDGKAVSSSSREMESKAGIWQKILGFFKALFGLIKIYPYAIENIF